jgi:hypothetical protein
MASTSQNPNVWSFLTAIPAEILILIYEAAFNVGDILLIRHYSANKRDGRPRDAFPRLGSSDTPSCMVSCTSLLRCCRVTYNEGRAALLSYKHLVFLNRRQFRTWRQWRECDRTQFVRIWLDELWSLVLSLRKIIIDISRDSELGKLNPSEIDVLPLLDIMFT